MNYRAMSIKRKTDIANYRRLSSLVAYKLLSYEFITHFDFETKANVKKKHHKIELDEIVPYRRIKFDRKPVITSAQSTGWPCLNDA